jgi:RNA polymerase sigma-70 factor (ECF subfamily)
VRQRGFGPTEAQDLTQEFFAHLIEKRVVEAADRDRGKFRSYLLTSLRNFLANQWDKQQAAKRGGARKIIPLDFASGESRFSREPSHELTPERLYQKEWAITLLDTVMEQLREEYVASGKEQQFDRLKPFLAGKNASSRYADAANSLGVSEAAAMTAASRLRRRYRELLHARIADTISDPTEIEEEMGALFEILAS